MRYYILLSAFALVLLACHKNKNQPVAAQPKQCECENLMLDRFLIVNWDGSLDTYQVFVFPHGNNFTKPIGSYSNMTLDARGYDEGFAFFLGDQVDNEYVIRLKHHSKQYRLKDYSYTQDSADCSLLNDSIRCTNSYQYTLNDSVIRIPKRIINYNHKNADTLYLHL